MTSPRDLGKICQRKRHLDWVLHNEWKSSWGDIPWRKSRRYKGQEERKNRMLTCSRYPHAWLIARGLWGKTWEVLSKSSRDSQIRGVVRAGEFLFKFPWLPITRIDSSKHKLKRNLLEKEWGGSQNWRQGLTYRSLKGQTTRATPESQQNLGNFSVR